MKMVFHPAMFQRNRIGRRLSVCAALFGLMLIPSAAALGQVRLGPNGPYTPRPKTAKKKALPVRTRSGEPMTFRMALHPAQQPRPSLKYILVPRQEDRRPGNAASYYYRALLAMNTGPGGRLKPLFDPKNYDRWMTGPMDQFPKDEVVRFLQRFRSTFRNLHIAAYREQCDWSWRIQDLNGIDAIAFLIEELQESRSLARVLVLKIRVAIAEKRYDDAIDWMRVGYKLAQDVAEPPTLINDLMGSAIGSMITAEVRNLIASPKSPNLYWALSSLPSPMIDVRPAMRYEMSIPMKVFPALKDAESSQRSAAEWSDILTRAIRDVQVAGHSGALSATRLPPDAKTRMMATALVLRGYPQAKRELAESGMKPKQIEAMPVGQVVAIHQARLYRHMYQEMMKWTYLPYHQAYQGLRQSERKLKSEGYFGPTGRSREIFPLAGLLLPATTSAYEATVRIDVRIAGLRVLEAIRMHASENNGRLPGSLSEIKVVPVPDNPGTGKPFSYRVTGNKAVLELPAPPGGHVSRGWRFEFTMR